MRRFVAALIALAIVAFVSPAHAMNWSLGANLGVSFVSPDGGDLVTVFGWPSSDLYAAPGLRVGFVGQNPAHEYFIDTSLMIISTSGASQHSALFSGNYQYNFQSKGATAPYLTGGVGLASYGFSDGISASAIGPVLGGGIGLRHKMGNGHGTLRGEVRFDHTAEGKDGNDVLFPAANTFGVKLGFDLWGK